MKTLFIIGNVLLVYGLGITSSHIEPPVNRVDTPPLYDSGFAFRVSRLKFSDTQKIEKGSHILISTSPSRNINGHDWMFKLDIIYLGNDSVWYKHSHYHEPLRCSHKDCNP